MGSGLYYSASESWGSVLHTCLTLDKSLQTLNILPSSSLPYLHPEVFNVTAPYPQEFCGYAQTPLQDSGWEVMQEEDPRPRVGLAKLPK